uniref:PTB domaincontaining adapter protein ced6like [Bombus terrestris] n=1 Tax=Lepeophtheirus salmonis TaxID=72036 RepID=A0A0K2TMJ5_LEPSM
MILGNQNWIHSPETLLKGHVVYLVKFLGNTEVDKPKGIEVVKQGIQKLKFNQQLKKSEGNSKTPKVELSISVDGVAIQDPKSKEILHQYALHKISYCADDKAEKRFFSFIAKEGDSEKHCCYVFVSDKLAEEITLTIGQAFELAYKKFLDTSGKDLEIKKQLLVLQKRIGILENENSELKKRLKDIADIKGQADIQQYLKTNGLKDLCSVREIPEDSSLANTSTTSGMNSMTEEGSSAMDGDASSSDNDEQLICLDGNKLEGLSLDDLNDDDFNPREGDGGCNIQESDDFDFNPRATEASSPQQQQQTTVIPKPLPALPPRTGPAQPSPTSNLNNIGIFNNNHHNNNNNGGLFNNNNNNPFTTVASPPVSNNNTIDPFGMTAFSQSSSSSNTTLLNNKKTFDNFESGLTLGNFSLDELDPLKK